MLLFFSSVFKCKNNVAIFLTSSVFKCKNNVAIFLTSSVFKCKNNVAIFLTSSVFKYNNNVAVFSLQVENLGECCKPQCVCVDQRTVLYKSYLLL